MLSRLIPVWSVFLLPLAFWAPFEDAFKLPQSILAVVLGLYSAFHLAAGYRRPPSPITLPVALLGAGLLASCLAGGMTRPPDLAVFLSLALSAVVLAGRRDLGEKLASAMVAAGTLGSLYSIVQYFGLDIIMPAPGSGAGLRPFSTMGNPDFIAAYLVAVLPIAGARWAMGGSRWNILPAMAMAFALLLTQSRGAWLGMAGAVAAVPLVASLAGKRLRFTRGVSASIAAALLVVCGFFVVHGQARERLSKTFSTAHFDAAGRIFMWKAGMGMVRERPLTGTGLGGFGMAYPDWHARGLVKNPGFPWFYTENAHNDYLQLPAEMGIPVFGLLVWVWIIFARMAVRLARSGDRLAPGILLGFISLQVDAFFNFPGYIVPCQAWFWVSLAILAGRMRAPARLIAGPGGMAVNIRIALVTMAVFAPIFILLRNVQADAWLKLSGDYLAAGRQPEARASAELAISRWGIWEGKARAYNNASLASYSMDDFASAERYSLASLELAPRMPGSISQLALARARAGKITEAEKSCREALQMNPHQAEAWHVLGNIAYMRHDLAGAREAWEKAFAENPSIPGLKQNLEVLNRGNKGRKGAM